MEAQLEMVTAVRKKFWVWFFFKPQPLTRIHIGASEGIQFSQRVRRPVKTRFLPGCQDDTWRLESLHLLPPPLEVPAATDVALWISEKPHGRTAWWEEQCLLWLWPLERYGELCRWLWYAIRVENHWQDSNSSCKVEGTDTIQFPVLSRLCFFKRHLTHTAQVRSLLLTGAFVELQHVLEFGQRSWTQRQMRPHLQVTGSKCVELQLPTTYYVLVWDANHWPKGVKAKAKANGVSLEAEESRLLPLWWVQRNP